MKMFFNCVVSLFCQSIRIAVLFCLALLIKNSGVIAEQLPFKCGVVTALTGPLAPIGIAIKNSIALASNQSLMGKNVEFIFEDDQFQPKNTVSIVKKFIEIDHVRCIVSFGSTTSLAVADIAERAKIPLISIAITPKVVEGRRYVYRVYVPVEKQGEMITARVSQKNYNTLAMVSTVQDATLALRDEVLKSISAKISSDDQVSPDDKDLRALAAKINSVNPSAVFLNLLPPQLSILARQLRSLGYRGDFFAGPTLGNPSEILASNGSLDDAWFVSLDASKAESFYRLYDRLYHTEPPVESLYGFDAANLIIENSVSKNLQEALSQLKKTEGILGNYLMKNNTLQIPAGIWKADLKSFQYCGVTCQ